MATQVSMQVRGRLDVCFKHRPHGLNTYAWLPELTRVRLPSTRTLSLFYAKRLQERDMFLHHRTHQSLLPSHTHIYCLLHSAQYARNAVLQLRRLHCHLEQILSQSIQ